MLAECGSICVYYVGLKDTTCFAALGIEVPPIISHITPYSRDTTVIVVSLFPSNVSENGPFGNSKRLPGTSVSSFLAVIRLLHDYLIS
jgi:hypothetical protein